MPPRYGAVVAGGPRVLVPDVAGFPFAPTVALASTRPPAGVTAVPRRSSTLAIRTMGVCAATT